MRSTTHDHLLAIVNTECRRFTSGETVRVLDAGCGKGALMQWLREKLPELRPDLRFKVYGFDVCDHGVLRDSTPRGRGSQLDLQLRPVALPRQFLSGRHFQSGP